MDLTVIRRMIMSIKNGGGNVVGEFSKYQRLTITPSDGNEIAASHNLGVIPKLIIVDGNIVTTGDFTQHFICDNDIGCGISTNNNTAIWSVDTTQIKHSGGLIVYMNSSEIAIRRQSSNRLYDTSGTYTVDLYA